MTDHMQPELLPCPFCGCTTIKKTCVIGAEWHECDWCQASGPVEPATEEYPETWNTRAADPLLAEVLEALRDAKDAMEAAHGSLFTQCLSNPVKNAWGQEVNMTKVNGLTDAAYRARAVLAKMEGK